MWPRYLNVTDRQTDGRTDGQTICLGKTALRYASRGKNGKFTWVIIIFNILSISISFNYREYFHSAFNFHCARSSYSVQIRRQYGHVTSSVTWPFDSAYAISHLWSVGTEPLSPTGSTDWRFHRRKSLLVTKDDRWNLDCLYVAGTLLITTHSCRCVAERYRLSFSKKVSCCQCSVTVSVHFPDYCPLVLLANDRTIILSQSAAAVCKDRIIMHR